jgi:hypothetical protein
MINLDKLYICPMLKAQRTLSVLEKQVLMRIFREKKSELE